MRTGIYKRYQYHYRHVTADGTVHEGISHGHFTDRDVLHAMLSRWTGSGRWSYWESDEDKCRNLHVDGSPLKYLSIGFWGTHDHHSEFNGERPKEMYA